MIADYKLIMAFQPFMIMQIPEKMCWAMIRSKVTGSQSLTATIMHILVLYLTILRT